MHRVSCVELGVNVIKHSLILNWLASSIYDMFLISMHLVDIDKKSIDHCNYRNIRNTIYESRHSKAALTLDTNLYRTKTYGYGSYELNAHNESAFVHKIISVPVISHIRIVTFTNAMDNLYLQDISILIQRRLCRRHCRRIEWVRWFCLKRNEFNEFHHIMVDIYDDHILFHGFVRMKK